MPRIPGVGNLTYPAITPVPAAAAWVAGAGLSSFAGTPSGPPSPPTSAVDVTGCAFDVPNVQSIAGGANYLIPPGEGYLSVPNTASTTFQLQILTGSGAGVWTTLGAPVAATAAVYTYLSDGGNVRVNNAGASAGSVTFYPLR